MGTFKLEDGEKLEPVHPIYPDTMKLLMEQNELILRMNTRIMALATTVQYKVTKKCEED